MQMNSLHMAMAAALGASLTMPAVAGITVYEDGDKFVKMGGRIQLQYHQMDPEDGEETDEMFFRRLRPYITGSLHKDWLGKFQFDFGKANGSNEVAVKDAYMQYSGFEGMKITVGNANFPFSREFLTSSKTQQLVERTFVGDHDYGTPDRNVGLHVTGKGKLLTWGASLAQASIDPDEDKVDFDTPVNKDGDFNEGWIFGGRADFHPFGIMKFSQGDFSRDEMKATIGVAAFQWQNDDDNNSYTDANDVDLGLGNDDMDVDSVTGFEISGAFRAAGFSVDAQYNRFDVDAVDSSYNQGLYEDGSTELTNWAVEGGYMIVPNRVELVAGYQLQDADGYEEEWTRTSVGANYFFHKHDIKVQASYRMGESLNGVDDADEDELFVQAQYVF